MREPAQRRRELTVDAPTGLWEVIVREAEGRTDRPAAAACREVRRVVEDCALVTDALEVRDVGRLGLGHQEYFPGRDPIQVANLDGLGILHVQDDRDAASPSAEDQVGVPSQLVHVHHVHSMGAQQTRLASDLSQGDQRPPVADTGDRAAHDADSALRQRIDQRAVGGGKKQRLDT